MTGRFDAGARVPSPPTVFAPYGCCEDDACATWPGVASPGRPPGNVSPMLTAGAGRAMICCMKLSAFICNAASPDASCWASCCCACVQSRPSWVMPNFNVVSTSSFLTPYSLARLSIALLSRLRSAVVLSRASWVVSCAMPYCPRMSLFVCWNPPLVIDPAAAASDSLDRYFMSRLRRLPRESMSNPRCANPRFAAFRSLPRSMSRYCC